MGLFFLKGSRRHLSIELRELLKVQHTRSLSPCVGTKFITKAVTKIKTDQHDLTGVYLVSDSVMLNHTARKSVCIRPRPGPQFPQSAGHTVATKTSQTGKTNKPDTSWLRNPSKRERKSCWGRRGEFVVQRLRAPQIFSGRSSQLFGVRSRHARTRGGVNKLHLLS